MKNKPLSPHLTVYAPQFSSVLSIFHRITGILLIFGLIIFYVLVELNMLVFLPSESITTLLDYKYLTLVPELSFLLVWSFYYHFLTGLRHLFWDNIKYIQLQKLYSSSSFVLVLAYVATNLTYFTLTNLL